MASHPVNNSLSLDRSRGTLLTILTLALAFNYVDRQVFALVLQNIESDLHLSDSQLGFLSGLAFAVFYAVMGVPIARLADSGNRVTIIAVTTAIWSVFVMLCGCAGSFTQLFLLRVGVAIGEAGCIPPAQSLLSDSFPKAQRAKAFSIYTLGSPLSVILGGFVAGWINQYYGWRITFALLGFPGIPLAVLAWLLLKDSRTQSANEVVHVRSAKPSSEAHSLWYVARSLAGNATFRQLLIAHTILYFFIYGVVLQWQPTFFVRTHGFTTGELGTWQVLIWSLLGTVGTYAGGAFVHRYIADDERKQLRLISCNIAIFGALNVLVYLCTNRYASLGLVALAAPFYSSVFGPLFAVNQSVVPESMRATAVAILFFFANLIGMGLGGFATGLLSDQLRPMFGTDSLRYTLLLLSPGFFWCALHFWLASRSVAADMERLEPRWRVQHGQS